MGILILWLSLILLLFCLLVAFYDVDLGAVAVQIYSILEVLRDKKLSLSDKLKYCHRMSLNCKISTAIFYRREFSKIARTEN